MNQIVRLVMYPEPGLAGRVQRLAEEQDRSTSAMLVKIVKDYFDRESIHGLIEARRRNLITHEQAVSKFATLIERDGDDGTEE